MNIATTCSSSRRLQVNINANICAFLLLLLLLPSERVLAITCTELEGAYILSQEPNPIYLGFFGSEFASESINNKYGKYGSEFQSLSVRNPFGIYGSNYGIYSANNSLTFLPPEIRKWGSWIGHLTTNSGVVGGVSLALIDANCSFYSQTPSVDPPTPPTSIDLKGIVQTTDGKNICAMVLASGQFMFSCNPAGVFSLTGLPVEPDGTVKRQIYADGFFPRIDTLTGSSNNTVIMTRSGTCPSYNTPYSPAFVPGSAGKRINIAGKVLAQNSQAPICAMVLANGQPTFSCDGSGSYAINIPLDNNGQFKLQVYADGFAPTIQTFDEFSTKNNVRMARSSECQ